MTAHAADPERGKEGPPDWQRRFVEQVGVFADIGVPRSLAQVLAWLVVCEPHHQSAEQIRTTLKMSAGSVSAAATMLVRGGVVARRTFPGDRRTYYELRSDGWQRLLRGRLQTLAEVRRVAEEAIAAAAGEDDERLRGMRDFYADCESQFAKILDDYAAAEVPRPRPVARKSARRGRS